MMEQTRKLAVLSCWRDRIDSDFEKIGAGRCIIYARGRCTGYSLRFARCRFRPSDIVVQVDGDTIEWINKEMKACD